MSRAVCGAELAVTSDGELVLNVRALEGSTKLEALVRQAGQQPGAVFVGVVLTPKEAQNVVNELSRILPNATRLVAAKRFWGRKGKGRHQRGRGRLLAPAAPSSRASRRRGPGGR